MSAKNRQTFVILSPHRDDAAFSCGALIGAAIATVTIRIINVFTRSTYAPFAQHVEVEGIEAVSSLREREDRAMMSLMQATNNAGTDCLEELALGLLDAPLRFTIATEDVLGKPRDPALYDLEVQKLEAILKPLLNSADCVVLPLGLGGNGLEGHIDHQIVRDAGLRCADHGRLAFYEDLPYAARMTAADRERAVKACLTNCRLIPLTIQTVAGSPRKETLAACYASQIDDATAKEIDGYAISQGGERIYAAAHARKLLEQV